MTLTFLFIYFGLAIKLIKEATMAFDDLVVYVHEHGNIIPKSQFACFNVFNPDGVWDTLVVIYYLTSRKNFNKNSRKMQ